VIEQTHMLTTKDIRQRLEALVRDWRAHLRANVAQGRQMIRRLLDGRR